MGARLRLLGVALWVGGVTALSTPAFALDISWNGFGSAYYGQAFDRDLLPEAFSNTHADFTSFSLMGLNLGASIDEHFDFAGQLVALGQSVGTTESFELLAQLAYLNYRPSEGLSLKLGRQLFPEFLASEFSRVAYLLPFRQLPVPVFNLSPFTRFDGASIYQSLETGMGTLTFGIFGGNPILDVNDARVVGMNFAFNDLLGAQVTLDGEGWRVRAQASRFFSKLNTVTPLPTSERFGVEQTYSVGYRYDRNNLVSWGEYLLTRTPDGVDLGSGRFAQRGSGYYWLGGYRIGRWLPRYTFARAEQNYNVVPGNNGRVTTHTVGLNYQVGRQIVAKAEYERDLISAPGSGGYFVTQPASSTATSGNAFVFGFDFIF